MRITPRQYQQAAVDAVWQALAADADANPCVELPTGTGKSLVVAMLAAHAIREWGVCVLVLVPRKELVQQNIDALAKWAPGLSCGICCAGLSRKESGAACIVASIQTAASKRTLARLTGRELVIVDEAHLIPSTGDGQYRTVIDACQTACPHCRVVGMTATPYRLQGGGITGPERILSEIVYRAPFADMVEQGHLCPLRTVGGARTARADVSNLRKTGADFNKGDLEAAFDVPAQVTAAVGDMIAHCDRLNRRHCLVFAAGVDHAKHVVAALKQKSQLVQLVTGQSSPEARREAISLFCGESSVFVAGCRWLVNVDVLTTGFDAPWTDCVVLLRATASTGLYVQMLGRGTRPHMDKTDCLVLDYGENVLRHGPVDMIEPPDPKTGTAKVGTAPAKECPECGEIVHLSARICQSCGYEWPERDVKHETLASDATVFAGTAGPPPEPTIDEYAVNYVRYAEHTKKGEPNAPHTLRVEYFTTDRQRIAEWVCPEHSGYARGKFVAWWRERTTFPIPRTAMEAVEAAEGGVLAVPTAIRVVDKHDGGFVRPEPVGDLEPLDDQGRWRAIYDAIQTANEAEALPPLDDDEIPF